MYSRLIAYYTFYPTYTNFFMENTYKLKLEYLKPFILGGSANFIVKEKNNNNHIEFKTKKDAKDENILYVKYKSIDWEYIGYIKKNENMFFNVSVNKLYTKLNIEDIITKSKIFRKLYLYIFHLNKLPDNIEILYTGRCSICNRTLTDPKYIEIGIGKVCLENL